MIKRNKLFLVIIGAFLSILLYKIWSELDFDFFHMATSARYILKDWHYLYENPTFVGEGYRTLIQQWLYCIIEYASYRLMGAAGVKLFSTLQLIALGAVIYVYGKTKGADKRMALLVPMLVYSITEEVSTRPTMASVILIFLQFIAVEKYLNTGQKKHLLWLPLIMMAEANIHGAYVLMHFILLLPYIVPFNPLIKAFAKKESSVFEKRIVNMKDLILPIGGMLFGMCINPYGITLLRCALAINSTKATTIAEMQAMEIFSFHFAFMLLGYVIAVLSWKKGALSSSSLYLLLGASLMYMTCIKNQAVFTVAFLSVVFEYIAEFQFDRFFEFFNQTSKRDFAIITLIALVSLPARAFLTYMNDMKADYITAPKDALSYLQEHEPDLSKVKLMTSYNSGGYFEFNGVGKIYLSCKGEVYSSEINGRESILEEWMTLSRTTESAFFEDFLDKYEFDYLFVTYEMPAFQIYLEQTDTYECVLESEKTNNNASIQAPLYRLYKAKSK